MNYTNGETLLKRAGLWGDVRTSYSAIGPGASLDEDYDAFLIVLAKDWPQRFTTSLQNVVENQLSIEICYCSLYNDCWRLVYDLYNSTTDEKRCRNGDLLREYGVPLCLLHAGEARRVEPRTFDEPGNGVGFPLACFRLAPCAAHLAFRVERHADLLGISVAALLRFECSECAFHLHNFFAVLPFRAGAKDNMHAVEIDRFSGLLYQVQIEDVDAVPIF